MHKSHSQHLFNSDFIDTPFSNAGIANLKKLGLPLTADSMPKYCLSLELTAAHSTIRDVQNKLKEGGYQSTLLAKPGNLDEWFYRTPHLVTDPTIAEIKNTEGVRDFRLEEE